MTEELEDKMREILKQNKVKPELWNIRTIMAMESSYRQGYIDAMQEMSKDSDSQEQYDRHHKPCDKVSHDCHIEYDTLSHPVYRSCHSCRLHRINDGENFCDYISRPLYWLAVYCKYWEK